jgi:hypothetical protein
MAEKIQISRVTNANVYLEGQSFLGRAEEINLPTVKFKMSEHKAIGLFGSMEFPSGMDKMECKIKWNSLYPEVMKILANPFKSVTMQVRASIEGYNSEGRIEELPLVIFLTVQSKDFPLGNFKQHDNVELENMFNVYYFKMEIDSEEIIEVNVLSNIYKVNGVDQFAQYRANLGI